MKAGELTISARIWRQVGLKVPAKQKKRGRIRLNDGSCVRHRAEHVNHVWTYDFVHDTTRDGRGLKFLTVVDKYSRECLAIVTKRKLKSFDVLNAPADLFLEKGLPQYIRSDNGPEFVALELRKRLHSLGVSTLFIEPGSPWENGFIESFNGKFRDEYLAGELFDTLKEAQILTDRWRWHYNSIRPHSSLGYRLPAPECISPPPFGASELRPDTFIYT